MSVQLTYFAHGRTIDDDWNRASGWTEGELSPLGRRQSKDLGRQMKEVDFDTVICSDLSRAIQTAEIAFNQRYHIRQDVRLRACNYGDFNRQDEAFKADMTKFIAEPYPQGESYQDVETRMRSFVKYLRDHYNNRHVALVGHQASQLALEVILHDRTWKQAIAEDWRRTGSWQPGWHYVIK